MVPTSAEYVCPNKSTPSSCWITERREKQFVFFNIRAYYYYTAVSNTKNSFIVIYNYEKVVVICVGDSFLVDT